LAWLCGCASTAPAQAPAGRAATISGFVFRDLNANGVCDPREPGEPGIVVSAYDADNQLVASTATDVNGKYVLNPELDSRKIVEGMSYIVQFTGLPPGVTSGPAGRDSGTELQFAIGGAANVNYGVFNPDQYVAPKATPGK
jgi:hypothetical protein